MDMIFDGPAGANVTVALAHGAGLGMDAPFMAEVARGLAAGGARVVRFEFPYMARRRETGKRSPPDRMSVLQDCFLRGIAEVRPAHSRLVLAGKSMGGRVATLIAEDARADGVIVYGYPFHPPGKPENLRTAHLDTLKVPALICQGERDPFGTRDEVAAFSLSNQIKLHWLPDGDHDLKPRKKSGHTHEDNLGRALAASNEFLKAL